jgi:hypothetical protein
VSTIVYPAWAEEMRQIFRAETISQFIIYGNINDYVAHTEDKAYSFFSLKEYLSAVLFSPFDVVLTYDRGQGLAVPKGGEYFQKFLTIIDKYHGTQYTAPAVDSEQSLAIDRKSVV